jgi:hypothetical protein
MLVSRDNKAFEGPKRSWKVCIKIYLRETGYEGMDWIELA